MGAWPDLATAIGELRTFLNDGPQDRPIKSKQLVGPVDGVNTTFETFDDRLVSGTLVVTFNYASVPGGTVVTVLDAVLGLITIVPAPASGITVRARYYYQYFLDVDLREALLLGVEQVTESADITSIALGLKSTTLNYAGYFAFTKQSIRWAQRMSERFILEDAPLDGEPQMRPNLFRQLAGDFFRTANTMRDSFYKRDSRRHAPAFAVYKPNVPPIGPIR